MTASATGSETETRIEAGDSLRIVVDQIPAVFWTTDAKLVFTSSLGAGLDRLGLGPNQLVGTRLGELFEADEDGGPVSAHRRALRGDSVAFDIKWPLHCYRAQVGPLKDSVGRVIGTICVALHEGPVASER